MPSMIEALRWFAPGLHCAEDIRLVMKERAEVHLQGALKPSVGLLGW